MEFCDDEKLLKKLSDSAVLLDQVQKGLNDYLETKRGVFARFYFLSNDDLLSILSESKDVMRVQPHFKKCFEAIDAVKFEPLEDVSELAITQMISPEKEVVPMMAPVDPVEKSVEVRLAASRGLDATRLHLTSMRVVSFLLKRPFGPRIASECTQSHPEMATSRVDVLKPSQYNDAPRRSGWSRSRI